MVQQELINHRVNSLQGDWLARPWQFQLYSMEVCGSGFYLCVRKSVGPSHSHCVRGKSSLKPVGR